MLGGCQYVGPVAIDQGRDRYNSVIQSTSKEQTFANIIRVNNREPTSFMDVTEVDATTTFSGTVSGAVTNIGARAGTSGGTLAGQTGGIASGVTYSEAPLIRYQPLLGQALVAQLATPVSTDALASLYDSSWDITPLLDLSLSFITLDADEFSAAVNLITELNNKNRLELVAAKSEWTKGKDSVASTDLKKGTKENNGNVTLQVTNKSSTGSGGNDSLVIYFLPFHPHATASDRGENNREQDLWNLLLRLYAGTQRSAECASSDKSTDKPGDGQPQPCTKVPNDIIELRTAPVTKMPNPAFKSRAPLMRTYSALGILKNAFDPTYPRIELVSFDTYRTIRSYRWNDTQKDASLSFYTVLPNEDDAYKQWRDTQKNIERIRLTENEIVEWLNSSTKPTDFVYLPLHEDLNGNDFVKGNQTLSRLRRYVLIITGDAPPTNAYVAHFDHGRWYYIDGDDVVSQKNFNLISLFTTMMAVPSATPPLSPVISVGGGGM